MKKDDFIKKLNALKNIVNNPLLKNHPSIQTNFATLQNYFDVHGNDAAIFTSEEQAIYRVQFDTLREAIYGEAVANNSLNGFISPSPLSEISPTSNTFIHSSENGTNADTDGWENLGHPPVGEVSSYSATASSGCIIS